MRKAWVVMVESVVATKSSIMGCCLVGRQVHRTCEVQCTGTPSRTAGPRRNHGVFSAWPCFRQTNGPVFGKQVALFSIDRNQLGDRMAIKSSLMGCCLVGRQVHRTCEVQRTGTSSRAAGPRRNEPGFLRVALFSTNKWPCFR